MEIDQTPHPPSTPARRPPDAGIDLDPARRPGVPKERPPTPWPHTRFPPARMQAPPSAPRHGRAGKPMPPVYGTAVPLHGVSGLVRRAAYRYPDHVMRHWTMLLFADRVDAWGLRAKRLLKVAVPLVAVAALAARALDARR
jgi:hypothetical protein